MHGIYRGMGVSVDISLYVTQTDDFPLKYSKCVRYNQMRPTVYQCFNTSCSLNVNPLILHSYSESVHSSLLAGISIMYQHTQSLFFIHTINPML